MPLRDVEPRVELKPPTMPEAPSRSGAKRATCKRTLVPALAVLCRAAIEHCPWGDIAYWIQGAARVREPTRRD